MQRITYFARQRRLIIIIELTFRCFRRGVQMTVEVEIVLPKALSLKVISFFPVGIAARDNPMELAR